MKKIKINEIFLSIQGESSFIGLPFVFVRFTGCSLRCRYCDTKYAYHDGIQYSVPKLIEKIKKFKINNVLITGGEPLEQEAAKDLILKLLNQNYTVLVETAGHIPINKYPRAAHYILDIKTPSSGQAAKMYFENLDTVSFNDEVKFVIGDKKDYEYSRSIILKYNLLKKTNVLFSPVFNKIDPKKMVQWIISDKLNVRFQLQIHKYIYDPNQRGV